MLRYSYSSQRRSNVKRLKSLRSHFAFSAVLILSAFSQKFPGVPCYMYVIIILKRFFSFRFRIVIVKECCQKQTMNVPEKKTTSDSVIRNFYLKRPPFCFPVSVTIVLHMCDHNHWTDRKLWQLLQTFKNIFPRFTFYFCHLDVYYLRAV